MEETYRQKVLKRRQQYELEGRFDEDIEDDPPTYELKPNKIDYLSKSPIKKIKTFFVNKMGQKFINKMIKQKQLVIESVEGLENFQNLEGGAIITCNHFHPFDNFAVWEVLKKSMHGRKLYKVIREGNYTNPPEPFGPLFRYGNTLPLSSNAETMKKFFKALDVLLVRGEKILIYPEQAMWWNYKKPRPLKSGAFKFAVKSNVPVLPIFITMQDSEVLDMDGNPVQKYSLHILPAIYPSINLSKNENADKMREENYKAWVEVYERVYKKPLKYETRKKQ